MRALRNSLVLNAICGISAQYLLRMSTESSSPGMVKFQGTKLPHLTEESVMQYQSTCINLLIDASANPLPPLPDYLASASSSRLRLFQVGNHDLTKFSQF